MSAMLPNDAPPAPHQPAPHGAIAAELKREGMNLWEIVRTLVFAAGALLVSVAVLAFIAFLLTLVMCFKVGWGPQGPMDPGWGIFAVSTGAICFVAGMAGLMLLILGRKNREEH